MLFFFFSECFPKASAEEKRKRREEYIYRWLRGQGDALILIYRLAFSFLTPYYLFTKKIKKIKKKNKIGSSLFIKWSGLVF